MKRTTDILVGARGLAVALVCGACLAVCGGAPVPPPGDAAYREKLQETVSARTERTRALARVNARLRALEARARRALPADATPEQVKAELEENPLKYPAYRGLVRERAECQAKARNYSEAQKMIRARHAQRKAPGSRAQGAAAPEK